MPPITQAKDLSLEDLHSQFQLQTNEHPEFFPEWHPTTSPLTAFEQQQLSRLQQNYRNLSSQKIISEEAVKMVILSPLLDLAGFFQAPFGIQTEESIEMTADDEGTTIKGSLDVLVVRQRFWILVIESKSTRFDVLTALPKALLYCLNAPQKADLNYGLLTNGREFVFVKLAQESTPVYARSYALSVERDEELSQVLNTLKTFHNLLLQPRI